MQRPPDLAAEIARLLTPEGVARLAAEHRDDGTGHCRTCPAGMLTGLRRDTPRCWSGWACG